MKKIIYILIFVFIILGLFFLNYKKSKVNNKTDLVFWTLQLGTLSEYINGVIDEFESQNPTINIVWIDVPYSEGEKRTLASILSNNPPDLVNLTPDFSLLLAQRKALYSIKSEYMTPYATSLIDSLKYNGGYFGFPFYATSALTIYNSKLFNDSHFGNLPSKYTDIYKMAEKIKNMTGAFVMMPTVTENDTFLKILNKYNINSPETINSLKSVDIFNQYKYLYINNLIPKESITQTHREALEKYMAGQVAFLPAGANFLNIIKENAPLIFKNTEITHQLIGDNKKYDYSLMNLIIPKKSKNPEAATKFALFLTNYKNQIELAKLTTILPVNIEALNDDYFTFIDKNDIFSKARVYSAEQLKNVNVVKTSNTNKKELLTLINNYVQQVLLQEGDTGELLDELSRKWKKIYNTQ